MFSKVRTSILETQIAAKSERNCQKQSQASKTREDGQQEGEKEVQKQENKSPGGVTDIDPAATDIDRAATGVIFGVDVVPLSMLAS